MKSVHVLKIGGELLGDDDHIRVLARRIALLPQPLVIVHGGGRQTTELAQRLGLSPHFHNGRRITDHAMLDVLVMTTAGILNKRLVAALLAAGIRAVGIAAFDGGTICATRRTGSIDFGLVGDPTRTDATMLMRLLEHGYTPVMSPLTYDGWGQLLNTNADTIAATVAVMFTAHGWSVELSFCTSSGGVLGADGQLLSELDRTSYAALSTSGVIRDGMLPKLDAAFSAAECGVCVRVISAQALPHRRGTRIITHATERP
ncbi:MAG: acetylglutamate kinase [Candidatus Kapaibacterium sp.]|nr:MAG: acetylglutamate kinase [Candidatus Kapabacteria bacterium]